MPVNSAMMNAAEPITGGRMLPPVHAATSMPPASAPEYPSRFIIGMVIEPVVTTSAVGLPEMVPYRPEDVTAILAAPPGLLPLSAAATSKKKSPPPVRERKVPNRPNRNTYVRATLTGTPKMPSVVNAMMSRKWR